MAVRFDPDPHPIRIARQKAGLSIKALAVLAGMHSSTLVKIETGRQPRVFVDQLVRLGEQLGIPWYTLVTEDNLYAHHDPDENGFRGEPAGALGAEGQAGEEATPGHLS